MEQIMNKQLASHAPFPSRPMTSIPRRASASSAARPAALLERLRRTLGAAEASTGLALEGGALLALGIPIIDGALGGGLRCGMLHEIAAAREIETAAATAFALALAARHDRIASPARSFVHPAPLPRAANAASGKRHGLDRGGSLARRERRALWARSRRGRHRSRALDQGGDERAAATCCGRWRRRCVAAPSAW